MLWFSRSLRLKCVGDFLTGLVVFWMEQPLSMAQGTLWRRQAVFDNDTIGLSSTDVDASSTIRCLRTDLVGAKGRKCK